MIPLLRLPIAINLLDGYVHGDEKTNEKNDLDKLNNGIRTSISIRSGNGVLFRSIGKDF